MTRGAGTAARKFDQNETSRFQSDDLASTCYTQEDNGITVQRVREFAEKRGLPMAQMALAWMLSNPLITAPIIGATKPHHLEDAIAALSVQVTPEEITHLEEAYLPHPVIGFS
jgi:aryl-alcohol dehydrogenase-like predicted oxidoreductase